VGGRWRRAEWESWSCGSPSASTVPGPAGGAAGGLRGAPGGCGVPPAPLAAPSRPERQGQSEEKSDRSASLFIIIIFFFFSNYSASQRRRVSFRSQTSSGCTKSCHKHSCGGGRGSAGLRGQLVASQRLRGWRWPRGPETRPPWLGASINLLVAVGLAVGSEACKGDPGVLLDGFGGELGSQAAGGGVLGRGQPTLGAVCAGKGVCLQPPAALTAGGSCSPFSYRTCTPWPNLPPRQGTPGVPAGVYRSHSEAAG